LLPRFEIHQKVRRTALLSSQVNRLLSSSLFATAPNTHCPFGL
jgi:hypothetical protein